MEPLFILYYMLMGLGIGFLSGLVGVGGGGMSVPIFAMLFALQGFSSDETIHLALGSSMAGMIVTTFGSMRAHYRKNNVDVKMAVKMSLGVLVGTFAATFVASYVSGVYLALFFSAFMMFVAYKMFQKTEYGHNSRPHNDAGNTFGGILIGAVSALVSISGAGLSVPYLLHQNFDIRRAIGTSAAIGFPVALSGTIGYFINGWNHTDLDRLIFGYVYLPAVVLFAISSYFSTSLGVLYAAKVSADKLKKVIGILSVLLSIKMLYSVI